MQIAPKRAKCDPAAFLILMRLGWPWEVVKTKANSGRPQRAEVTVDPRIGTVLDLITKQPHRCWSVAELAESVKLSPSRLRSLFHASLGVSPVAYLRHHRMCDAERMLRSSHLKVKDIMRQVGVADASHFTRDFTAKFGSSPLQYRRSQFLQSS